MATRPTMFIGSSVESVDVARAVQGELQHDVDSIIWNQGIFALSQAALDALLDATREHDFACFILAPDDIVMIRDEIQRVPRDNVMFELGMFFGAFGADRCFFLIPKNELDFHIPTDLAGITPAKYDPKHKGGLDAAVGPACNQIRKAIKGTAKAMSLSGNWEQTWVVDSNGTPTPNSSIAEVAQAGNRVRATFQSLGNTYEVNGVIERGNVVTGRWYDTTPGPTYFGSFQLVIDPLGNEMQGVWIGWSKKGTVRSGEWTWRRIKPNVGGKKGPAA